MARLRSLAILARRHPDAVEWALGAAAALAVVGVSLSQWGWTEAGLSRGVSLGLPTGLLTVWVYRRRRRRDEIREQAQIEGRLGLARELHDAVAGQVAMMGIQAAAARRVLAVRPDDAATALERIEDASRAAVGDLRRMLDTLRGGTPASTSPATPGLAGLGELVAEMERAGLIVDSRIEATDGRALPAALDHAAYRIVQELLTNALKHGAGTAQVQVRRGASDLEILRHQSGRPEARGRIDRTRPWARRAARASGDVRRRRVRWSGAEPHVARRRPPGAAWRAGSMTTEDETAEPTIRVLLVDDQAMVRAGLRMILETEPDLEVIGEAANGREALELAEANRPDVVLIDVQMPVMDGLRRPAGCSRPTAVNRAPPESRRASSSSPRSTSTNMSSRPCGRVRPDSS